MFIHHKRVSECDSINAKLAALSEKASNINSVLITITKVADQTNILSLNAEIEAAERILSLKNIAMALKSSIGVQLKKPHFPSKPGN